MANFFYLFENIFRIYLIYQFMKVFFSTAGNNLQRILRFVCLTLFFFINSIGFLCFHWEAIAVMASNLIGVFILTFTYSGKWKFRVSAAILIVAVNLICEEMVYKLLLELNIEHIIVITMAISNLLFLMIILILQKISSFRHGENILFLEWLEIILIPVISIVITIVTFDQCKDEIAIIVGGTGLLVLNTFVFYLFDHLADMYRTRSQLMILEAQNQTYEKQLAILVQSEENISSLRHDMKNHIIALQQLAEQTDNTELKGYLNRMNAFTQPKGRFVSTGEAFIDGLLNLKLDEAAEKTHAEIICDVRVSKQMSIDKMDFSILLGNLLDNAVQALEKCKSKKSLKFLMEQKYGALFIRLENSHREIIKEKGCVFLTTKKDKANHGIGLKNVKRIVDKYSGTIRFVYTDQSFIAEILIPLDYEKAR